MTRDDLIVLRFLDEDLTSEELAVLEARLAREPELRARLEAFSADDDALASLPAPERPADLGARILQRIAAEPRHRPAWHGVARMAIAAAVAFCVGGATVLALVRSAPDTLPSTAVAAVCPPGEAPPVAVAAATAPDAPVPVRFVHVAPQAAAVSLVGDFNGWGEQRIELLPTGVAGVFETTVPLPRGEHEYMFVVNGEEWVPDALAARSRPDGFGRSNSVIAL